MMGKGTELNKSEIEKLARTEPVINKCFKHGDISNHTYIEKLECMVLLLVLEKNSYKDQLLSELQNKANQPNYQ